MKLKWIAIPVFILVAALIFMFFPKKNKDFSEDLIGRWTTSEPKYIDCFLELTKTTFAYGFDINKQNIYEISSVEKSMEGNRILYSVSYKDRDGVKFTRSFYYDPENGGTIQFKHQEHIKWCKLKDDDFKENSETDQNKKAGQDETNS